jgi:hypothetical protein
MNVIHQVFNYFAPYADLLRKEQKEEEKEKEKSSQGGVGESIKEEKEGNDLNINHNENENNSIRPRRKTALNKLRCDNDYTNGNDSSARNKRTLLSKQSKNNNENYDDDSDDGNKDEDEDDVKVDMKNEKEGKKQKRRTQQRVKRHGSYITQHDMWASDSYVDHSQALPSAKPLFNWEHVLLSVQDYADSLLKINSSNITVRYTQYLHSALTSQY